ncbi:tryptophan tryptophylquinone biosynthesis enzyme MauG [Epibacterium sp. SM1969]|uniref:Methylamine utilization protein MauG n=1 Tax=Tritonibacter aquimaris TaxID=2663379 RepID=A0A844B482_9RHOB|nr:cytochrome c peroxidase [Tritonibacter aquimaris]MQY44186.1 tryptophan tryptophylquinone biosynthesis enzyme MauG [Tritonibacter aquimaris]
MRVLTKALFVLSALGATLFLHADSHAKSYTYISAKELAQALTGPDRATRSAFRRPTRIPFPPDNAFRHDAAVLGKMLFFDPRLSGSQNISCSTCHNPSFGWATPVHPVASEQERVGRRHAPSIVNVAWTTPLFWDGRAATLEDQAVGPILDPNEMDSDFDTIIHRLEKVSAYRRWFDLVYPDEGITAGTVVRSLATYQRTIVSGGAPFDDWISGNAGAISDEARRGFELFRGRAGCISCHSSWMFTDNNMHDIGLRSPDLGQGALEGQPSSQNYHFKTPGLRNITMRAPYMHDGSIPTLREVIRHYANGGSIWVARDVDIEPFTISETEIDELIAFLNTLSTSNPVGQPPTLPAN